jgi:hypothetical protein
MRRCVMGFVLVPVIVIGKYDCWAPVSHAEAFHRNALQLLAVTAPAGR